MAFPATELDLTVSLAIGADLTADPSSWSWTDVTPLVREKQKVTITRGRRARVGQVVATRVSATVDNTDGNLCRHNPFGTHFGTLKKNTPMKVEVNNGGGNVTRAAVFVPGFPPSWDPSETDHVVTLNAVGIMDRLGRAPVVKSPLYRTMAGAASPKALWTLEDGTSATSGANSVTGGKPMTRSGPVTFGTDESPAGAGGRWPTIDGGSLIGTITGVSSTAWRVEFSLKTTELVDRMVEVRTGGSIPIWKFFTSYLDDPLGIVVQATDLSNATTYVNVNSPISTADYLADFHHIAFTAEQSGSNVVMKLYVDGVLAGTDTTAGAATLGAPTRIVLNPTTAGTGTFGYVGVYDGLTPTGAAAALDGYVGEMAHDRVQRIADEEGIRVSVTATTSVAMGPQIQGNALANFRDCAKADQGILYESMDFGLAYLAASERYNASPAITLEYDQGEILPPWEPDDDDQDYFNDVTATRPDGSPQRVADEADIAEVGDYSIPASPNVETDALARQVAGWLRNQGLNDELSWPAVRPNLYLGGALLNSWLASDIGDQMHITGHPSPLASDTIKQVIEGYTEVLGSFTYTATVVLSSATNYTVAKYGSDAAQKRYDSRSSSLATAVDDNDTTLSVRVESKAPWITTAGQPARFPFDIALGGLTYSCTAISSPAFVAAGTAAHADNASVSPGLPAGATTGDLLLIFAATRGAGTVNAPSGYSNILQSGNIRILGKVHSGSESAPTVTFSGGSAGDTTSAQMCAFRRMDTGMSSLGRLAFAEQSNASAQDMATPSLTMTDNANAVILYFGWKQDDWTSVASPGTEIGEPSSTTGSDQGLVWSYVIQGKSAHVNTSAFVVTGGGAAISRTAVVAMAGLQAFTVTRLTPDRAHAADSPVHVYQPARYGL